MKLQGFIGPAYTLKSVNVDCQRCVNLYPEINEMGKSKGDEIAWLRSTPGLEKLLTVGLGPIRLIHVDSIGRVFVVSKDQLYYLTESGGTWSSTLVGQNGTAGGAAVLLDTINGPIRAASVSLSGLSTDSTTVFVDGTNSYLFLDNGGGSTNFGEFALYGYPKVNNATQVIAVDGYLLYIDETNKFYCSNLNDITINPLSFGGAEGDPDKIKAIISNQRDVWLLNERSSELFVNTGNADFPFERVGGGFIEKGILAPFSVAKIDAYVFWLGRDEFGQGVVYAGHGLAPERVSTHSIETEIQGYADPSNATAYTYSSGGHSFYVLNFDEATWVYDVNTKLWHERGYLNSGTLERHRGECHGYIPRYGIHMIGDYVNNKVYQFNDDYYTDDTDYIQRIRSSPHISNGLSRIFYSKLQLDMETGVGLATGQGSDPQVIMQFSDDGGHTWSSEAWASAGVSIGNGGNYNKRVIWRRLGKSRDRVFRITITDPVKVAIIGAEIEVQVGAN